MTGSVPLEPALRYDPVAIAAHYRNRPLAVGKRWLQILLPSALFVLRWWRDRRHPPSPQQQKRRAIQLRETLTRLGPAYIKMGQALSTRPDLLPSVYLEELTRLQDDLPPFPNAVAYQFIQEELGGTPDQVFAELTPNPVAAASLGQVYRGRLRSGEAVAVKVQRPDLAEQIALDMYLLRQVAAWAERHWSGIRSNLVAILDEFATRLFEEMDYTQEGRNAERFASLYGHLSGVYVPKIYWDYTNRRVLTMEWISGTKLTRPQEIQAQGIDARAVIETGVQCSLRQLLEHGFFHADPHPGNLLVMPTGDLAYLDFGMMSEIKPYQRYGLINAVVHIVNRDFDALIEDYIKLDFLPADTDPAPLVPVLAMVFQEAGTATVSELNFQVMMQRLSDAMYELPFRVPAYYALIVRSLVAMEGIAIGIDPNFKVLSSAYPYIAKRLLTDPAPELRISLGHLLLKDGNFRWARLEKLLANAGHSSDYDFNAALDQGIDFLFSERGELIRLRLADELVNSLDSLGETVLERTTALFRLPSPAHRTTASLDPQMVSTLRRILSSLRNSPGFDPVQVTQAIATILAKPEVQQTGRYVFNRLTQKAIARLIGQFLLPDPPPPPPPRFPRALPMKALLNR